MKCGGQSVVCTSARISIATLQYTIILFIYLLYVLRCDTDCQAHITARMHSSNDTLKHWTLQCVCVFARFSTFFFLSIIVFYCSLSPSHERLYCIVTHVMLIDMHRSDACMPSTAQHTTPHSCRLLLASAAAHEL